MTFAEQGLPRRQGPAEPDEPALWRLIIVDCLLGVEAVSVAMRCRPYYLSTAAAAVWLFFFQGERRQLTYGRLTAVEPVYGVENTAVAAPAAAVFSFARGNREGGWKTLEEQGDGK